MAGLTGERRVNSICPHLDVQDAGAVVGGLADRAEAKGFVEPGLVVLGAKGEAGVAGGAGMSHGVLHQPATEAHAARGFRYGDAADLHVLGRLDEAQRADDRALDDGGEMGGGKVVGVELFVLDLLLVDEDGSAQRESEVAERGEDGDLKDGDVRHGWKMSMEAARREGAGLT